MARLIALIAVAAAVLAASGCRSTGDPLAQDLTPEQYFQRAIDASDRSNYRLAMRYYEAFQARYPDDVRRNVWASYEIAVLHHKLGNDVKAVELLDELLAKYDAPQEGAAPLPAAPRVLARKVKGNILKGRKPAETAAPSPAAPVAQQPR